MAKRCVLEQMFLLKAYRKSLYEESNGTKLNDLDVHVTCCLWIFTDILFLSEVKTTSGFGRDRDTI